MAIGTVDYVSTAPWNDPYNPYTAYATLNVTCTGWPTITMTLTGFNPAGGLEDKFSYIGGLGVAKDLFGTISALYLTTQGYDLTDTPLDPVFGLGHYGDASNRYLALIGCNGNESSPGYKWLFIGYYPETPTINPYPNISCHANRKSPLKVADFVVGGGANPWSSADGTGQDGSVVIPHLAISPGVLAPWEYRRKRLLGYI